MKKKLLSLICLLLLSSGLQAMLVPGSAGAGAAGAGAGRRRAGSADEARIAGDLAANFAGQQKQLARDGRGDSDADDVDDTPGLPPATITDSFASASEGEGASLLRITGSDLARGQLNMHQSLANVFLLGKASFAVNGRKCSSSQNQSARYALEQLVTLERTNPETRTTTYEADLGNLIRTLSAFPESQQAVLHRIQTNPADYRQLYPTFMQAITTQLREEHDRLTATETANLQALKEQLFGLYGGELLESRKAEVFENNTVDFTQRVQSQEWWPRRHWGKFAAGAAAFGFVARPYVEAGVRHTARVGVRVALNQLISKFTGGDSAAADAVTNVPPAAE